MLTHNALKTLRKIHRLKAKEIKMAVFIVMLILCKWIKILYVYTSTQKNEAIDVKQEKCHKCNQSRYWFTRINDVASMHTQNLITSWWRFYEVNLCFFFIMDVWNCNFLVISKVKNWVTHFRSGEISISKHL